MAGSGDGAEMGGAMSSHAMEPTNTLMACLCAQHYKKAEQAFIAETLASRLAPLSSGEGGADDSAAADAAAGGSNGTGTQHHSTVKWTTEPQGTDEELRNVILLMHQKNANSATEMDPSVIENA